MANVELKKYYLQLRFSTTRVRKECPRFLCAKSHVGNASANVKEDFSVHIILSNVMSDYWVPGTTKFNCTVTDYNNATGQITFTANSDVSGTCKCIVLIRSAEGTGELKKTLVDTKTFIVKQGSYILSASTMNTTLGVWSSYTGSWGISNANISSWGTFTEYKPDTLG